MPENAADMVALSFLRWLMAEDQGRAAQYRAYREYYEPIATCIDVALPGPCDSDLTSLPFVRIPRPLWPWDPDLEWDPIDTQKGNRP